MMRRASIIRGLMGRATSKVSRVISRVRAPLQIGSSTEQVVPVLQAEPNVMSLSDLASSNQDKFVVFFAPEAGVVPHFITTCVVAKTLEELGQKTLIVRCFNVYPRCVVMDGELLPHDLDAAQRKSVCERCSANSRRMTGAYELNVVDLQELLNDEIRDRARALAANVPEDISTFEFEGIRFGKICGAEAAVNFKTTDLTGATPSVRRLLVWYLEGALLSYFAMQELLKTGKVSRVVHLNEYAILLSAALAASEVGIPTTNMTLASIRGIDRRRIVFMKEPLAIVSYRNRLAEWNSWCDLVLPKAAIVEIGDDCLYRMMSSSAFVYSPLRTGSIDELYSALQLDADRKLLVAFTSSLDELGANDQYLVALGFEQYPTKQPFRDQIDWLEALIERVESSSDLQLVVRIHPREGANKREKLVSGHLGILTERFSSRPYKHVRFVWPRDQISSYDLMELADVGLSAWSSTALEMARLGVPVLAAFDLHTPFPTGDVVSWASTVEGYFRCLRESLATAPSLVPISFAYRWYSLRTVGCALDFSDIILDAEAGELPDYVLPSVGREIVDVLVHGKDTLEITREKLLAAQGERQREEERAALLGQLRRCIWFLCFGEDQLTDYRLFYAASADIDAPAGYDAVLKDDGRFVELKTSDRIVRRRSRMVGRLAALAAQNACEGVA
jgi:hypothetical protein